jgi:hypothetical protein
MGFWFLDEKSQLALLISGLVGSLGAAGCGDNKPVVVDPAVRDGRVDHMIADPLPPDHRIDKRGPIYDDPAPRDTRLTDRPDFMVVDMVPVDMRTERKWKDAMVVDMVPFDAAAGPPGPQAQPPKGPGAAPKLPLARDLRAKIAPRRLAGGELELKVSADGVDPARLTYRWKVSGGSLDRTDAGTVRWTPPAGTCLAQVTVRDGDRAIAVEVYIHNAK